MGLLDDLSREANKLADQITTSVDDTQARHRLERLLHDYGLLLFLQQTGRPTADSPAELERIWREVHELLVRHPNLTLQQRSRPAPAPAPPGQAPLPPPPPATAPPRPPSLAKGPAGAPPPPSSGPSGELPPPPPPLSP